jgi:hypothetical protein
VPPRRIGLVLACICASSPDEKLQVLERSDAI